MAGIKLLFLTLALPISVVFSQTKDGQKLGADIRVNLENEGLDWLDRAWASCPSPAYMERYCNNMCTKYKAACRQECSISLRGQFCGSYTCGQVSPGICKGPNVAATTTPVPTTTVPTTTAPTTAATTTPVPTTTVPTTTA